MSRYVNTGPHVIECEGQHIAPGEAFPELTEGQVAYYLSLGTIGEAPADTAAVTDLATEGGI